MKLQAKAFLEDEERNRRNQLPPHFLSQASGRKSLKQLSLKENSESDSPRNLIFKPKSPQLSARRSPTINQIKIPAAFK
jgi:hypothetical protein